MELTIKSIDITKADLGLRHEYVPQVSWNLAADEDDRVVVELDYLKVGERMKYISTIGDGGNLDTTRLFKDKVRKIKNFKLNGSAIKTAEQFLRFPVVREMDEMLNDVCMHLVLADTLNEEEEKN